MSWPKRDMWKVGIALAGLLIFLVVMVLIPLSASTYAGTAGIATLTAGIVQATPTVDATIAALNKEKLTQEVQQLKDQNGNQDNWVANNSTALIAAAATVVVALFGILQWAITVRQAQDKESRDRDLDRQKEITAQDKELRAQAETRLQAAITALGDGKESVQVGGAILLRSFLNPGDEEVYGRYYTQIFDLAVAYLRPSSTSQPLEDPNILLPLTPLRQVLIVVFREAFPLARDRLYRIKSVMDTRSIDAAHVRLDSAPLIVSDLKHIWMREASLKGAVLNFAYLNGADLRNADLRRAELKGTDLRDATLIGACLIGASLTGANLAEADLSGVDLREVDLTLVSLTKGNLARANLSGANFIRTDLTEAKLKGAKLDGTNIEKAKLENTDLRGVYGLTKEQLLYCKAMSAIVDKNITATPIQATTAPTTSTQNNNAQTPSTQTSPPPPDTNGSSASVSQQSNAVQTSAAVPAQTNTPAPSTGESGNTTEESTHT